MQTTPNRSKGTIVDLILKKTGYENLSKSFIKYLFVYVCYMVAVNMSNTFFNVFLLRATGSAKTMASYNLLLACIQPFVMLLAVIVLRKTSVNMCQRTGLMLHGFAYLVLALVSDTPELMIYVLSCVFSAGNAFYYTSYTPQILAYTLDETRDTAYGAMGLLGMIGNLTLPILTGFFISSFGDLFGYKILFALSSLILFLGVLLSLRLDKVSSDSISIGIFNVAKRMFYNKKMLRMLIVTMITGIDASGYVYFTSILVYGLLKEESTIGVLTTAGAVVGLFANLVYGRIVKSNARGKSMLYAAITFFTVTVLLAIFRTASIYIVFWLLSSFVRIFITNPTVTEYMYILQKDELLVKHGAEVHSIREFFYASGKALGLAPAYLFVANVNNSPFLLMYIVFAQIIGASLLISVKKNSN